MPKKLDFRIKMGRNGRATKITYEIHKIFILFFFRAENNALICSMFYAIQRESLTLPYTPLEREFKELFNHI